MVQIKGHRVNEVNAIHETANATRAITVTPIISADVSLPTGKY